MRDGICHRSADNGIGNIWEADMRINSIQVQNFRGFENLTVDLDPKFTLLIGENASGKTSLLSALSVALGIWHTSRKGSSWRKIEHHEIRRIPRKHGDRPSFEPCEPVCITASGLIGGEQVSWRRMIKVGQTSTTNDANEAIAKIKWLATGLEEQPLPVLAYYGAGRSWLASNERVKRENGNGKPSQWDAYYGCLNERIRTKDLINWFYREAAARDDNGRFRYGYEVVRYAIKHCIPDVEYVGFDHETYLEPIITFSSGPVLFSNMSDGFRSMVALIADIAIKAVTLNSHLAPTERIDDILKEMPAILERTPGVVLVDEIDVHLHPSWQRQVASDICKVFPNMQFVCSSHSPQVISELDSKQILFLKDCRTYTLERSRGLTSNQVLEELLKVPARNVDTAREIHEIAQLIEENKLNEANQKIDLLGELVGRNDPAVVHALSMLEFLRMEIKE